MTDLENARNGLRCGHFCLPARNGRSDVDGEVDEASQGVEQVEGVGQQTEPEGPEPAGGSEKPSQVNQVPDYKALLDRQDERIRELESQVAEAAKSKESADKLATEIERLRADAAEERVGYELRLAGARSVTAAKALLGEHGGDVAALKAAAPWLFEDKPAGGTTGLEPAGAAGGDDSELKRWRGIAGLEDGD